MALAGGLRERQRQLLASDAARAASSARARTARRRALHHRPVTSPVIGSFTDKPVLASAWHWWLAEGAARLDGISKPKTHSPAAVERNCLEFAISAPGEALYDQGSENIRIYTIYSPSYTAAHPDCTPVRGPHTSAPRLSAPMIKRVLKLRVFNSQWRGFLDR